MENLKIVLLLIVCCWPASGAAPGLCPVSTFQETLCGHICHVDTEICPMVQYPKILYPRIHFPYIAVGEFRSVILQERRNASPVASPVVRHGTLEFIPEWVVVLVCTILVTGLQLSFKKLLVLLRFLYESAGGLFHGPGGQVLLARVGYIFDIFYISMLHLNMCGAIVSTFSRGSLFIYLKSDITWVNFTELTSLICSLCAQVPAAKIMKNHGPLEFFRNYSNWPIFARLFAADFQICMIVYGYFLPDKGVNFPVFSLIVVLAEYIKDLVDYHEGRAAPPAPAAPPVAASSEASSLCP